MVCHLVVLDHQPWVSLVGIRETLIWEIFNISVHTSRDQANVAYGNLQLCSGLEAGIKGKINVLHKRKEGG